MEDDYIQETLNGMDVSCIFVKRDIKYYDFIPKIKTRDEIKDYLKNKDQSVIEQFERWWDKYKVSLNQIDSKSL